MSVLERCFFIFKPLISDFHNFSALILLTLGFFKNGFNACIVLWKLNMTNNHFIQSHSEDEMKNAAQISLIRFLSLSKTLSLLQLYYS